MMSDYTPGVGEGSKESVTTEVVKSMSSTASIKEDRVAVAAISDIIQSTFGTTGNRMKTLLKTATQIIIIQTKTTSLLPSILYNRF